MNLRSITDSQLDDVLTEIKAQNPTDNEVMMAGHLIAKGIWVQHLCLRFSLHRIDPERIAKRRSSAIKRHVCHVGEDQIRFGIWMPTISYN